MTVVTKVDLYKCDLCGTEVASRSGLPEGWMTLSITLDDGTIVERHVSKTCLVAVKQALASRA